MILVASTAGTIATIAIVVIVLIVFGFFVGGDWDWFD